MPQSGITAPALQRKKLRHAIWQECHIRASDPLSPIKDQQLPKRRQRLFQQTLLSRVALPQASISHRRWSAAPAASGATSCWADSTSRYTLLSTITGILYMEDSPISLSSQHTATYSQKYFDKRHTIAHPSLCVARNLDEMYSAHQIHSK